MIVQDSEKVIGIPAQTCFMCGKNPVTRHHAIPKELNPQRNVTIPLCLEHKDVTHHVIKQFYFPEKLRLKLAKIKKHNDALTAMIKSFKMELDFSHNPRLTRSPRVKH